MFKGEIWTRGAGSSNKVQKNTGQPAQNYVVALNTALVLWAAGIEDDLHAGFNKALLSINRGSPWEKFLLLKTYLSTDELIAN